MSVPVPWTRETAGQLKKLGFNTIPLNVAWGRRPGDKPLTWQMWFNSVRNRTGR